jgi:hypothetical protein
MLSANALAEAEAWRRREKIKKSGHIWYDLV